MKIIALVILLLLSNFLRADENENLLKDATQTVHLIWTEWMGNPKLTYEHIDHKSIEEYCGTWSAKFRYEGKETVVTLTLSKSGAWSDNLWNPGKTARWYLSDGMIVLFEEPGGKRYEGLASAIVLKGERLHLLYKGAKDGLIPLKKQEAGQGSSDQPVTAPESKAKGEEKPKPKSEVRPQ